MSTRKKIIFFQKCYRSSFEGYKKWMHQKIRSLNVFFIVLDTKVTKRVPANKWAGYSIQNADNRWVLMNILIIRKRESKN